ncbi:MAG: DUF4261 domain-containing protein [Abitibacteriaceae bacterium]|nr:DUF4261 domain-containing protein [Abditibacteriaceae bacterium]
MQQPNQPTAVPDRDVAGVYAVVLFYEQLPQINKAELLEKLRAHCGNVIPLDGSTTSDTLAFAYADHKVRYQNGELPAQCLIAPAKGPLEMEHYESAFQQTWDWPQARAVVGECKATLLLTDMLAAGLEPHTRLDLFTGALLALLEVAPCRAIYWQPSQQFIEPSAYIAAHQVGENYNPLYGAINVRLFEVQGRLPGEKLMDTRGLATLGLPDLQCHFVKLDPNEVGHVLYNSAFFTFDRGDIIEDGHTIQGIKSDDKWRCQHEDALAPPERVVLDLDPGPPYAAGDRN